MKGLIMDVVKKKRVDHLEITPRMANYLEKTGWKFKTLQIDPGQPGSIFWLFEKRIPVGDVVRGMLEWIKVYSVITKIVSLRGDDVTVCHCVVCCSEWPEGDDPDHYDSCDAEAFAEVFADE